MDRDDGVNLAQIFLLSFLLGLVASHCTTVPLGASVAKEQLMTWVEKCWPNKPVWGNPSMACWVNGRKVIVD